MALQTVAHASNPVQAHTFLWTIENFAKITDSFWGPSFNLISKGLNRFRFDLSVQEYDQNFTNYTLEVNLSIQDEDKMVNQTRSSYGTSVPSTGYQTFNLECDVILCTMNGINITSAKTVFAKVSKNTSLKRRVLFTFFRKMAQKSEFFAFREDNKLIDLCDDKLILKATFSVSGHDTGSSISSSALTNSQLSHVELVKNLKTMFESGPAHDLTFSVGGRSIPVHKAVVCRRSPVFGKMLEHDMVEKRSTNIAIEDAEFSTFNNFLLFLYTGEIAEKDWESVLGIYSLADKYQVDSLRKECSSILSGGLAVSSFCRILVIADLHNDLDLMDASKVFFRGNFSQVIQIGEWAQLVESKPELASTVLGFIKEPSTT
ncbi:hypothetical protein JTE90_015416 [Oedothorax gibbosus]|uniref:BTB domain-containing protein n=1 Tax=Oedothorax gibbosus TaxID=931172 RepID=A0AAV6TY76_9ARAC|nr:hypothetical protein JTE90_015416 [Oedothorax gibbosus]